MHCLVSAVYISIFIYNKVRLTLWSITLHKNELGKFECFPYRVYIFYTCQKKKTDYISHKKQQSKIEYISHKKNNREKQSKTEYISYKKNRVKQRISLIKKQRILSFFIQNP
jgi:hypothetical protein